MLTLVNSSTPHRHMGSLVHGSSSKMTRCRLSRVFGSSSRSTCHRICLYLCGENKKKYASGARFRQAYMLHSHFTGFFLTNFVEALGLLPGLPIPKCATDKFCASFKSRSSHPPGFSHSAIRYSECSVSLW